MHVSSSAAIDASSVLQQRLLYLCLRLAMPRCKSSAEIEITGQAGWIIYAVLFLGVLRHSIAMTSPKIDDRW